MRIALNNGFDRKALVMASLMLGLFAGPTVVASSPTCSIYEGEYSCERQFCIN